MLWWMWWGRWWWWWLVLVVVEVVVIIHNSSIISQTISKSGPGGTGETRGDGRGETGAAMGGGSDGEELRGRLRLG